MVLAVPAIRPSTPLEPGQPLKVPAVRPSTLLSAGGWIHLPEPRAAASDNWDLDTDPTPPTG
jgi:hypothetical protein